MKYFDINKDNPIILWWSGGVTSAVADKLAIDLFGIENVRIVFIDTKNEDDDTYRFLKDCEKWYNKSIETISSDKFDKIQDVWYHYVGLNFNTGAICSTELKRAVREKFNKDNAFSYQVFGFDIDEPKRAKSMAKNYPKINPIFILLLLALDKKDCIKILTDAGIEIPVTYKLGFNNNCFKTGCVQGVIGYWQKMQREFPDKFYAMAAMEHKLTYLKGKPVTMLKDQGKNGGLVFLMPHPDYPDVKDISMMKGKEPKPLFECNGMCGINDFERNETETEINYQS